MVEVISVKNKKPQKKIIPFGIFGYVEYLRPNLFKKI
jgi:hypothetical protein